MDSVTDRQKIIQWQRNKQTHNANVNMEFLTRFKIDPLSPLVVHLNQMMLIISSLIFNIFGSLAL